MDERFIEEVKEAVELARSRKIRELGRLEKLSGLALVEKRLLSSPERSDAYYGRAIQDLIFEAIDNQKPTSTEEDISLPTWSHYILLRDYVKRGEPWEPVAHKLGVGRTTFYKLKNEANDAVAARLWKWEEETRTEMRVKHNLPSPTFPEYIERHNYNEHIGTPIIPEYDKNERLASVVIDELTDYGLKGLLLVGAGGTGKTVLAYTVAQRCIERRLFEAVIWASAKKKMLTVEAASFSQVPFKQAVLSYQEVLDTIAHVLHYRKTSSPQVDTSLERFEIVNDLLRTRNCLIVIDNLEELTTDDLNELKVFVRRYAGMSKVLLTSRHQVNVPGARIVNLPGMTFEEAGKFIRLECEMKNLPLLKQDEQRILYDRTMGLPLAMGVIIGLIQVTGFSLKMAIQQFQSADAVLDFLLQGAYDQLTVEEKELLYAATIFEYNATSEDALTATSGLAPWQVRSGLGKLFSLKLVLKTDSRYRLGPLVREFLENRQNAKLNGMLLSPFIAKAYVAAARYYIESLRDARTLDNKLAFLTSGEGDEKWNALRVMQGCQALAKANFQFDGGRPFEAWSLLLDLFEEINEPLGILWYHQERLRWAQEALTACSMVPNGEKRAAWIKVFDLAWTYLIIGQEAKAREILIDNLELAQRKGWKEVQALALCNLGRLEDLSKANYSNAREYFNQALELWKQSPQKYRKWIPNTKAAIGRTRLKEGHLLQAKAILEESLDERKQAGYTDEVVEALSETARVYAAQDGFREAFLRSDQALQLAREATAPPSLAYGYALMLRAEIEEIFERLDKALEYAKKACDIYTSLGAQYHVKKAEALKQRITALLDSQAIAG